MAAKQNNQIIKVVCPMCSAESEFEIWQCINATESNGLIEKVKDGTMFRHTCPACNKPINIEYSFLYHQVEDALMIHYCIKDEEAQSVINSITKPTAENKGYIQQMLDRSTIVRIVRTKPQLLEKICIYDSGYDDRAVEIMKLIVASQFAKENPDKKISHVYFNIKKKSADQSDAEGEKIVQIFVDNKPAAEASVNEEIYKKIFNDYVSSLPPLRADHNIVVNSGWAKGIMELKNAKPNPAE